MKTKIFVSFDYIHDSKIKDKFVKMAKKENTEFSMNDVSITEPVIDEKWRKIAREKIKECDLVVFLCGQYTKNKKGVVAEMTITQELNKPYILIKGYKEIHTHMPCNHKKTDIMTIWDEKIIAHKINSIVGKI